MSIQHGFTYEGALADSQKVSWRVEDLVGPDKKLDFTKPFLPDALAGVNGLRSLSPSEKLSLNHIRGATYLHLFGFVEEFILPFTLEHARKAAHGDSAKVRALTTFADEEAKHIDLFHRFAVEFERGFGAPVATIGPAAEVAEQVLRHGALGVVLVILHLEWLTQRHYLESVKTDEGLDHHFASLLKHHWQEEAQHAKIDTLLAADIAHGLSPDEIKQGIDDFLSIGGLLEGGLRAQVDLDLDTLEKTIHRKLSDAEREEIRAAQVRSYRWTFLASGLDHPRFIDTVGAFSAEGRQRITDLRASLLN
jgi:hypothetical protein